MDEKKKPDYGGGLFACVANIHVGDVFTVIVSYIIYYKSKKSE